MSGDLYCEYPDCGNYWESVGDDIKHLRTCAEHVGWDGSVPELKELTEHQMKMADALVLAAAGSMSLIDDDTMDEYHRIEAMRTIIATAPSHLKDDFERCCAYFIYRDILMQASGSGSLELILEAQNAINGMLNE